MSKYAIMIVTYPNGVSLRKWGKIIDPDPHFQVRVLQLYDYYPACSSDFHIYDRTMKTMEKLYNRAVRHNLPSTYVSALHGVCYGAGWPESPVVETIIERLTIMQELVATAEREKLMPSDRTKPRVAPMTPEQIREFNAKCEEYGFKSRWT